MHESSNALTVFSWDFKKSSVLAMVKKRVAPKKSLGD